MNNQNVFVEITDLFKYNYILRRSPSPESFSGHSHNLYEILYFIKGDATYVIEDKKYKLSGGDLIITRPSKYHFIQMDSDADYERHNILFDHKRLGIDMRLLPKDIDVVNLKSDSIIGNVFKKFGYYAENFSEKDFMNISALLIQEMMYNLSLIKNESENNYSVINPLLSRALGYIGENIFTIKEISEVAQAVFVTDSYLYRLFKKELLKSPKKYIVEKRLIYAQNQIKRGRRPTEVAVECGFDDYTTFYRNYVEIFGKNPSDEVSEN